MPCRPAFFSAVLCCLAGVAAAGPVSVRAIVRGTPQQRLFVARIDLTDPRVRLRVVPAGPDPDGPGPWDTILAPTSTVARDHDFDLAINCVYFGHVAADNDLKRYATGDPAAASNLVIADGKRITHATDGVLLGFDDRNRATIVPLNGPPPAGVRQGAAGSRQIVTGGRNTAGTDDANRYPRTAAGIADDGKTLVLIVADGRRPGWADGLTLAELADEMIKQGCRDAVNFDGGGSSTMVRRDGDRWRVLNTPSDGSQFLVPLSIERPVAFVLGVTVDTKPDAPAPVR